MSTNTLLRRVNSTCFRHSRITFAAAALVLIVVAILMSSASKAASPSSGTINPTTGTSLTWDGNATGGSSPNGEGTCVEGVNCDTFTLNVSGTPAAWAGKMIYTKVTWTVPASDYDLYIHKGSNAGPVVNSSGGGSPLTSEQAAIIPSVSGTGIYTVHVVYFSVAPQVDQYHAVSTVLDLSPRPAPQGSGPAGEYLNYPAPNGLGTDAGEPSLGVNWNSETSGVSDGGTVMFQAGLQTLRVKFSNTTTPASSTWEEVTSPNTSVASLDPISFTDHQTGRTLVSQLTGQDSLSALTDNDGGMAVAGFGTGWIPSQGGGIPSGVDHQSIGGGRYAGDLTRDPNGPVYPNAVYYCSQDLATAFCARSDDGGLTYGPGIPLYFGECGGIHGHVKVSPADGTVYVPNHTCGGNQGVAKSEDNGITWTVRRVVKGDGSVVAENSGPADWDPSVGIGANGTLYFGYKNFDGTAHMAVSLDHGKTWFRDYDVGAAFNVATIAFPAVVAGDDDRAAFAFLGTTGVGGPSSQVWHLYVAHTYDRGASYITTDLTPNDPVQVGSICSAGLSCAGDRNLLDFMDVTIDKQGRVLVGYADGCPSCTNAISSQTTSALATIARECGGRGLLAQYDALLAASSCGNPSPTPTPTPTPDSCDGVNVITDSSGDATNPAPGGQGPTSQADIKSVTFSADATTLTTTMTIANLSQTPSPGSTFTSYYVVWTSSNGITYGTVVDVDPATTSFTWGEWDSSNNQLKATPPPQSTTGTFNPGPNGTMTVNVPRSGIGNPTIPITNPSDTAAVTNPFSYTVAGIGVIGSGLVYTTFMDRGPNSGTGPRWAVCPSGTPTPTPTPSPSPSPSPSPTATPANCVPPGITVLTDPANDQLGGPNANQQQDVRSIAFAEQYPGGNQQLVVTMTVSQLDPTTMPPNGSWRTSFNVTHADNTVVTYFVSVNTNTSSNPTGISFNYGFVDTTGASPISRTVGAADSGSLDTTNKRMVVVLSTNKLKKPVAATGGATLTGPIADLSAGRILAAINGTTSILVGALGNGLNTTIDTTGNGNYQMVGPAACPQPSPSPTPPPTNPTGAPRYFNYAAPPGYGDDAGEPSIGVNFNTELLFSNSNGPIPNGGTSMYFGGFLSYALKVTFSDCPSPANANWEKKSVLTASTPRGFGDPILFTDPETGRTFVSQLEGLTPLGSTTDFTDNDGDLFLPSQGSGIATGIDHQTIGGGPLAAPLTGGTSAYKNGVWYCSQALADASCALSLDGGVTFGPQVVIYSLLDCVGIHGHIKVAPDGTVYVPNRSCGSGQVAAVVSADNGVTWAVRPVPGSTTDGTWDPSIGIAKDGSIYMGYRDANGRARAAVSRSKGATWTNDQDVGAQLGLKKIAFPAVVAGDGGLTTGRSAFAFYGTTTDGDDQPASFPGVWYLYISSTFDGGQTWTTQNVTPGDPIQRGCIWAGGGTNPCRNMLDFFDAAIDKEGRVLVGWDDGCIGPCVQGPPNSGTAKATITRQTGGPRMLSTFDPVEPALGGAPLVTATQNGTGAPVIMSWAAPDHGGAAITGYRIYRSATAGGIYTLIGSPTLTNFTDPSPGSTSFYRVTAVNSIGEGPYCSTVSPAPPGPSACSTPGIKVIDDVNAGNVDNDSGQNTPPDPRVNIKNLYVAEPYLGAGVNKLVFRLNLAPSTGLGMTTPPPNSQWYIVWDRIHPEADFDRWYVAMKTDALGATSFEYGKFGVPIDTSIPPAIPPNVNPNANTPVMIGSADSGSYNVATGVVTITLSTSKAENIQPGQGLSGLNVRTYLNRPDPGQRSQNNASDITDNGIYALRGNASCQGVTASTKTYGGQSDSALELAQRGESSTPSNGLAANSRSTPSTPSTLVALRNNTSTVRRLAATLVLQMFLNGYSSVIGLIGAT